MGGGFSIVPRGSLAYLTVHRDGYTETGLGANNLTVADTSADALRAGGEIALEYQTEVSLGGGMRTFSSEIRGGAQQEFALDDRTVGVSNPLLGTAAVQGADDDETQLTLGAGMSLEVSDSAVLFMGYDAEIGGDQRSHMVNLGVRFSW